MGKDLVSIICSVYNGEKFLEKTIKSCLQQVDVNIEIIIIDDYSTDYSRNIIISLADKHSNIKVLFNDRNLGFTRSVNKAVKSATGEYLLVIGHDDKLPSNHVKRMIAQFDEKTSFVHCNAIIIDEWDQKRNFVGRDDVQIRKNNRIMYELSFYNCVYSTGLVMRLDRFKQVKGYPEEFRNYGEWQLWIKLAAIGNVKYTDSTFAYYRRHETNMTNSFMDEEVSQELKSYYDSSRELALSHLNLSIKGQFSHSLDRMKRAIIKELRQIKYRVKRFK